MRRAAVQAFRTARCAPVRKILVPRNLITLPSRSVKGERSVSSSARNHGVSQILQSSMYFRNFSIAAIVSLFASGVYYYKGDPAPGTGAVVNGTSSSNGASRSGLIKAAGISSSLSASSATGLTSPAAEEASPASTQRKALVVEDDQFYTHDISDDAPLSKETSSGAQQQLEMLTPEQVTEKLRRSEESYLVGRGRGVVRYDMVQIPSNNPIEDDHAEKIIGVPESSTLGYEGSEKSDWMFWGVFDGHR